MINLINNENNSEEFKDFIINKSLKYITDPEVKGDIWAGIITLACIPFTGKEKKLNVVKKEIINNFQHMNYKIQLAAALFISMQTPAFFKEQIKELMKITKETIKHYERSKINPLNESDVHMFDEFIRINKGVIDNLTSNKKKD